MGLQRYPVGRFRGGVNLEDSPQELETSEAQAALNFEIRKDSGGQREGKTRIDDSTLGGARRIGHMRAWYEGGANRLIFTTDDGAVYSMTAGGVVTNRIAGGSNSLWHFESATDSGGTPRLWALDGVTAPKRIAPNMTVADWANNPPNGTMMRLWRNRMCIAGVAATPQRLFFSDIGNPESPAASYGSNWIDIKSTEDDLDPITWLEVCGTYLLVFKRKSVWAVADPDQFTNHRLGGPGCEGRFMSCEVAGKCYYFARNGLWSVDGTSAPEFRGEKLESWVLANLNYEHLTKVRVGSSPLRHNRIYVAIPVGSTVNSRLLELYVDLPFTTPEHRAIRFPWMIHDYGVGALANFRATYTEDLVAGDSGAAEIHRLFDGTNDDGAAISSHWQTGWLKMISEEPFERIRRLNVQMSGDLSVDVFSDFNPAPDNSATLSVDPTSDTLWDGGVWDGGTWDPASSVAFKRSRPESRGRYHSIKFRNAVLDKTFTIYAAEAAIRGGKEH